MFAKTKYPFKENLCQWKCALQLHYTIHYLTMGRGKDLTEEKSTIIEEIATGIAKEIGRHVGTVRTESL